MYRSIAWDDRRAAQEFLITSKVRQRDATHPCCTRTHEVDRSLFTSRQVRVSTMASLFARQSCDLCEVRSTYLGHAGEGGRAFWEVIERGGLVCILRAASCAAILGTFTARNGVACMQSLHIG